MQKRGSKMKTNIFYFILLLFCLTSQITKAGYEVGNGGIVVACRDEKLKTTTVELLDIFEVRNQMQLSIDVFESKFYFPEKWLSELYSQSPERSTLYGNYIANFDREVLFYTDKIIPPTKDSGTITDLPANCKIEQLIIQRASVHPKDSHIINDRYIISSFFWEKLSPLNKAAAKLHEAIYRERIAQCISLKEEGCFPNAFMLTSEKIRKLVGLIVTKKISSLDSSTFDFIMKSAGIRGIEKNGIIFIDTTPEYPIYTKNEIDSSLIIDFTTINSSNVSLHQNKKVQFTINDYFHSSWSFDSKSRFMTIKFGKFFLILQQKIQFLIKPDLVKISPIDNLLGSQVYIYNSENKEVSSFLTFDEISFSALTNTIILNSKLKPHYFQ